MYGGIPSPNPNYKQEIKNVEPKNLFNKNTIVDGAILYSNGTITSENNYKSTDYIPVQANSQYHCNYAFSSSYYGIAFYNSSKQYISGNALTNSITTPNNCSYVRFAMRITGSSQLADIDKVQFEERKL